MTSSAGAGDEKNALYVQSLASLKQDSLLPGIRDVLADIRAAKVKIGSHPYRLMLTDFARVGYSSGFRFLRRCFAY